MIFLVIVLGMIATVFAVSRMERSYTAFSVLILDPGSTAFDTVTSRLRTVDPAVAQTEVEVLRSRELAGLVAEQLELFSDTEFYSGPPAPGRSEEIIGILVSWWNSVRGWSDPTLGNEGADNVVAAPEPEASVEGGLQSDPSREAVIDKLLRIYSVRQANQSLAIEIHATYKDPERAAEIANSVAELYIAETLQSQRAGIENAIEFLTRRADGTRERLSSLRTELATLIRINALDDNDLTATMIAELRSMRTIADLANTEQREDLLTRIERTTEALRVRTRAELERSELELALDIERQRFQSISDRLAEYESQRDSLTPPARMITFAQKPDEPSAPQVALTLAVAFVSLLVLTFVGALIRSGMDNRARSSSDLASASALPDLGSVPKLPKHASRGRHALFQYLHSHPFSAFGQAVRALVTVRSIPGHALMFCSTRDGEGKSTLSAGTAISAASDGLRVLVIDLDLKKRGVSRLLGAPPSGVFVEEALERPEIMLANIHRNCGVPRLDVANFHNDSHFGKRLSSGNQHSAEIAQVLFERYDLIILDTASDQAPHDASRFQFFNQSIVLVSRWGVTSIDALVDLAEILRWNGLDLVGVVLNSVDHKKSTRRGYKNKSVASSIRRGALE